MPKTIYDTPEMLASTMYRQQHRANLFRSALGLGAALQGNKDIVVLDMSYWQVDTKINYDLLAANIDGVILRGVYGIWKDTRFDIHYKNFHDRGVPIGTYGYLIGNKTGKSQARALRDAVADKELLLEIWADIEDRRLGTKLSRFVADQFVEEADKLFGKTTNDYTGPYAWKEIMKYGGHSHRKLWIANYGVSSPRMPIGGDGVTWWLWQYTDRGRHPGYLSSLDTNKFNGTNAKWTSWVGGEVEQPLTLKSLKLEVDAIEERVKFIEKTYM